MPTLPPTCERFRLLEVLGNVLTRVFSTANSISAANDMTSLAPKWLNIKRGQLIACTLGVWGFAPWKVLDSAENFVRAALLQAPLGACR